MSCAAFKLSLLSRRFQIPDSGGRDERSTKKDIPRNSFGRGSAKCVEIGDEGTQRFLAREDSARTGVEALLDKGRGIETAFSDS